MHELDGTNSEAVDSGGDHDTDNEPDISTHDLVAVPRSSFRPCHQLKQAISSLNPVMQCDDHGKSLYLQCINIAGQHLLQECPSCCNE